MTQTISLKLKLKPTVEQELVLQHMVREYSETVRQIAKRTITEKEFDTKMSSKHVDGDLPGRLKAQAIRDAKTFYTLSKKRNFDIIPDLFNETCVWNNQSYKISPNEIDLSVMVNGSKDRMKVKLCASKDNRVERLLSHKLGTATLSNRNGKWMVYVALTINTSDIKTKKTPVGKAMGIDLGIKVPAVAITEDGKVKFFGNGRENKFMKRKFASKRKELMKNKKMKAVIKLGNKEQRWMQDKDHKISREIVNFAKENGITVIKLEKLSNIRQTVRLRKKQRKDLHSWSFYRLSSYIEYKANMEGIKVVYVNPAYTSQICPSCGEKNKVNDRNYKCKCGYKGHRDLVGAKNICFSENIIKNK